MWEALFPKTLEDRRGKILCYVISVRTCCESKIFIRSINSTRISLRMRGGIRRVENGSEGEEEKRGNWRIRGRRGI